MFILIWSIQCTSKGEILCNVLDQDQRFKITQITLRQIKETGDSVFSVDLLVPLMHRDLSDLGSQILNTFLSFMFSLVSF